MFKIRRGAASVPSPGKCGRDGVYYVKNKNPKQGEDNNPPEMGEVCTEGREHGVTHVSTINVFFGRPCNSVAKRFRSVSPQVKEEITYLFTLAKRVTKVLPHLSFLVVPGGAH